jgi:hypothetical protein
MPLQTIAIGALFALSLVTLALAATARADEPQRRFVPRSLTVDAETGDFAAVEETWSQTVQDLSAMLDRVRDSGGYQSAPYRGRGFRIVTLAEAAQDRELRRQVVEELELVFR